MNNLGNGLHLTRFDTTSSLVQKVMQVNGMLVVDQMKTSTSDVPMRGYTSTGADIHAAGTAGTSHDLVPTNLAVHDFVEGNLGLKGSDDVDISPTHTEYHQGRQKKLYLGGDVSPSKEVGFSVDEAVTLSSNNLVTSGAVQAAIADLIDSAPANLDTLRELAQSINNDSDLFGTLQSLITSNATALASYKTLVGLALDSPGLLKDLKDLLDAEIAARDASIAARTSAVDARFDADELELSDYKTLVGSDFTSAGLLKDEKDARVSADDALGVRVDDEEAARAAAVSAEESARISADDAIIATATANKSALEADIAAEAAARLAKDAEHTQAIADEVADRVAAVSAEASARAAAVTALSDSVDAEFISQRSTSDSKYHHKLKNAADDSVFASVAVDSAPTNGNANLVTSAGVYSAIQAAKAEIIDGAPDLLNTLNEIAASINDDENFAATMTNSLSTLRTDMENADALRYLKTEVDTHRAGILAEETTHRSTIAAATSARNTYVNTQLSNRHLASVADLRFLHTASFTTDGSEDTNMMSIKFENGALTIPVNLVVQNITGVDKITFSNGFELLAGDPVTVAAGGPPAPLSQVAFVFGTSPTVEQYWNHVPSGSTVYYDSHQQESGGSQTWYLEPGAYESFQADYVRVNNGGGAWKWHKMPTPLQGSTNMRIVVTDSSAAPTATSNPGGAAISFVDEGSNTYVATNVPTDAPEWGNGWIHLVWRSDGIEIKTIEFYSDP